MGKKKKSRKDPEFSGLLLFMFQNRIPLLTITLAALVVSVVVSLLITPRYRSSVILYPANFTSISRSMMGPSSVRGDIMQFGQERDSERLLQVLNSEDIRSRIIEKFDLMQHYGIDPESSYPQTTLNRKFQSNIRFRKTEYMAIEIEVLDADPAIAAAIANDIALFADSVINTILMEPADHSLEIATEEYMRLKEEIAAIEDSLKKIREIGVIDYESQAEVLNDAYATSILNKDTAGMNFFRGRLRMLSSYGGAYVSLRDNLLYQNEKLNDMRSVYDEARINTERAIPYKFVVDRAREAEKKAYPVRSLIVAASTMAAFLLSLFILLLADAFTRKIKLNDK